jgi:hypothetical protein
MHLAAVGDDLKNARADARVIIILLAADLSETCRVDIEKVDIEQQLVIPEALHSVIDFLRRLGQDARRGKDPMAAQGVAVLFYR